jgi:tight adherence protein B
MCSAAGLGTGLLGGLLARNVLAGMFLGAVGSVVPVMYLIFKRRQRREKLLTQLPDSFELMSRILRAGQTISQAMHAVATEFAPPVSTEFGYCHEQQNLGLNMEAALHDLARRTGLIEVKIYVLALLVHRKSGGNLAELLDNLALIVRERFKIRSKIKALTAEGRFQACSLLVLPLIAFAGLLVVNRPYALKLLDYPWLILASVLSMAVGAYWIRRIVNFDF